MSAPTARRVVFVGGPCDGMDSADTTLRHRYLLADPDAEPLRLAWCCAPPAPAPEPVAPGPGPAVAGMSLAPVINPQILVAALAGWSRHEYVDATTCVCGYPPAHATDWDLHRLSAALAAVADEIGSRAGPVLANQPDRMATGFARDLIYDRSAS